MQTALIGLGLIGGSLGLALKGKRWGPITGYAPHPETRQKALAMGVVDRTAESPQEAVRGAGLVVLATPISALPQVMAQVSPALEAGAVVTDTASTKAWVLEQARAFLPPNASFIGGHPMAGKEAWGIEAASVDLFRGAPYVISAAPGARGVDTVKAMAEAVGARPLFIEAGDHDRLVAGISHLPLFLAAALTLATARHPEWPLLSSLAASGYRDTTRLASGSPRMGRDICFTNKAWLLFWLDQFLAQVQGLREDLEKDTLEVSLAQARQAREAWLQGRGR